MLLNTLNTQVKRVFYRERATASVDVQGLSAHAKYKQGVHERLEQRKTALHFVRLLLLFHGKSLFEEHSL